MDEREERLLRERFAGLSRRAEDSDWEEVKRRTRKGSRRPAAGLVLAAGLLVAVAAAPPFGLGGRIVGLFSEEGKPIHVRELSEQDREALVFSLCRRIDLVSRPGKAPLKRCLEGEPQIEEIANNGRRFSWKLTYPNGRTCVASGSVHGHRDPSRGLSKVESISCTEGRRIAGTLVPSRRRPITSEVALAARVGDRRAHLTRVYGLAGEGVAEVGLVEKGGDVLRTPVRGRAYEFPVPPRREWVALAAFDASGKEVFREPIELDLPPRPAAFSNVKPPPPRPLPPLPDEEPIQHGEVQGASVDVYRSGLVAVRFESAAVPAYRILRQGVRGARDEPVKGPPVASLGCADVAYGAGRWEMVGAGGGSVPVRLDLRVTVGRSEGFPSPPFDVCSVGGTYGRVWNDSRGTHDVVEVAFTPVGRRFFGEQASARHVAWFVRSGKMHAIRDAMKRGAKAPPATEVARRFRNRVVPLATRTETAPGGRIGVWSNARDLIVVSERAPSGRRLYVTLPSGRIGRHNLRSLASVL